jgi:hypothetical protein
MSGESDETAVLVVVQTELEATLLASSLEARGIRAEVSGGLTAGFRAEAPGGARVLVRAEDLERAAEALKAIRRENAEIDWSQVDVGEME